MVVGLELIRNQRRIKAVSIVLDNQAAIRAISQRRSGEAHVQSLVDLFHEHLEAVQKKHLGLRLTIRDHVGVTGNGVTDRKAKEAAQNRGIHNHTLMKKLTRFLDNSAKVRQNHHEELKARPSERWEASPRFEKLNHLDPKLPSKDFPSSSVSSLGDTQVYSFSRGRDTPLSTKLELQTPYSALPVTKNTRRSSTSYACSLRTEHNGDDFKHASRADIHPYDSFSPAQMRRNLYSNIFTTRSDYRKHTRN